MHPIEKYLLSVEKPARYTGNEMNSIVKDKEKLTSRFCFCFPDIYEIGMSHLGLKCIYDLLNKIPDVWCERAFMPWSDMRRIMQENDISLYALESKDSLAEFDILGFTLQYEMSYTNVLAMLELSKIPFLSSERDLSFPIICAGGPCAVNPEPLADFIDFFMIGEGEEVLVEVMDVFKEFKSHGSNDKRELLYMLDKIEGVYVPAFYEVTYNVDGTIRERIAENGVKEKVKKRFISDFENLPHPEDIIVPYTEIVHDRVTLEIFRGCIRGCRFCQAGFIYRPVRERSNRTLSEIAERSLKSTGYDEVSLCSLSTSDFTELRELTDELLDYCAPKNINLCLPSLRVDNFNIPLAEKIQSVRKTGLTFAPEAGSQRMRDVINKNICEEDILKTVRNVFFGGWSGIKLYFMIGLPFEKDEDVTAIGELAMKSQSEYYSIPKEDRPKGVRITVSVSSFVPKPFTPFMWAAQDTVEELTRKQELLRQSLKSRMINLNWHDADVSVLEGVFARGDRRLGAVILSAYKKGCVLDGWNEHFKYDKWMEAFEDCGVNYKFYNHRERSYDEILPWDFIDVGVTKEFLKRENEKARAAETTPNCRTACAGCGAPECGEKIRKIK